MTEEALIARLREDLAEYLPHPDDVADDVAEAGTVKPEPDEHDVTLSLTDLEAAILVLHSGVEPWSDGGVVLSGYAGTRTLSDALVDYEAVLSVRFCHLKREADGWKLHLVAITTVSGEASDRAEVIAEDKWQARKEDGDAV